MTAYSKGAKYERRTAHAFTDGGIPAERRGLAQARDGGDDIILPPDIAAWLSVECKDQAATSLGAWLDQAVNSAGDRIGVVVHHRRGNGNILDDFGTVRLRDLIALVKFIDHLRFDEFATGGIEGREVADLIKDLRP